MDLTSGCFYRYNIENNNLSSSDAISDSVTLKANANYTGSDSGVSGTGGEGVVLDPNSYGKWLNTNLMLKPSQFVQFYIKGEVSLCKAYIPINNLQQDSNLDNSGNRIEIPRVEDKTTPPVSLIAGVSFFLYFRFKLVAKYMYKLLQSDKTHFTF